jgi:hypothetical protein
MITKWILKKCPNTQYKNRNLIRHLVKFWGRKGQMRLLRLVRIRWFQHSKMRIQLRNKSKFTPWVTLMTTTSVRKTSFPKPLKSRTSSRTPKSKSKHTNNRWTSFHQQLLGIKLRIQREITKKSEVSKISCNKINYYRVKAPPKMISPLKRVSTR